MNKCYFCKKEYDTYPIILNSNIECFVMEEHIKDLYYDEENDIGVCKLCRDKHIHEDPCLMIQHWLSVKLQMMLVKLRSKDKSTREKFSEAIDRIDKYEERLEKDPKVQFMYFENNPAGFYHELDKREWNKAFLAKDYGHLHPRYKVLVKLIDHGIKKPEKCMFCSENKAQIWINNPNHDKKGCWKVCIPCNKIIDTAGEMASTFGVMQIMKKHGIDKGYEAARKKFEEQQQKMKDIAHEDGQGLGIIEIKVEDLK